MTTTVTIQTAIEAPLARVWEYWTNPIHIVKWNNASDDWHTPHATNDLRTGGSFTSRMEARDGSMGFDFGGVYDDVRDQELIAYTLGDSRRVEVRFSQQGESVKVTETFETEQTHPVEMQRMGWQSILDNFKKYTEENQ